MSLLNNAIDALIVGLEDFEEGSDKRLKSAVRNVHAGVLLIFKEKLRRLSGSGTNEALLKQRIVPKQQSGSTVWVGVGKKTADIQTIRDRFKHLGITANWNYFDDLTAYRNEIEHYFSTANSAAINTALAKAFAVVSEFSANELNEDPATLFTVPIWARMTQIQEVYQQERALCVASFSNIDSSSQSVVSNIGRFKCDDCGSDLILVARDGPQFLDSCFSARKI